MTTAHKLARLELRIEPHRLIEVIDAAIGSRYGVLYWCRVQRGGGRTTLLEVADDGSEVRHPLTRSTIVRGLELAAHKGGHFGELFGRFLAGRCDAPDCDLIVQLGIFGTVKYG